MLIGEGAQQAAARNPLTDDRDRERLRAVKRKLLTTERNREALSNSTASLIATEPGRLCGESGK
jgi:hypothetical protein